MPRWRVGVDLITEATFEAFYKERWPQSYRYYYWGTRSTEVAEDLSQTLFLSVYGDLPLPIWVFYRRRKDRLVDYWQVAHYNVDLGALEDEGREPPDPDVLAQPEARALARENHQEFLDKLNDCFTNHWNKSRGLTPKTQACWELARREGMARREIALAIGKPESFVKEELRKGDAHMRVCFPLYAAPKEDDDTMTNQGEN